MIAYQCVEKDKLNLWDTCALPPDAAEQACKSGSVPITSPRCLSCGAYDDYECNRQPYQTPLL
ncbi:MAG: hypothetical protein MJZ22_05825, partial [Candidatus Saccharibacteria bacterium]|nr:hypothetical protein [Candidatus Saccharibacteria bacterium]